MVSPSLVHQPTAAQVGSCVVSAYVVVEDGKSLVCHFKDLKPTSSTNEPTLCAVDPLLPVSHTCSSNYNLEGLLGPCCIPQLGRQLASLCIHGCPLQARGRKVFGHDLEKHQCHLTLTLTGTLTGLGRDSSSLMSMIQNKCRNAFNVGFPSTQA